MSSKTSKSKNVRKNKQKQHKVDRFLLCSPELNKALLMSKKLTFCTSVLVRIITFSHNESS